MSIQFIDISPEELVEMISQKVEEKLQDKFQNNNSEAPESEYLTPDETCVLLKVTKPTIWRYRKRGKLTAYYFENKVYYKRSEIYSGFTKGE